MNFSQIYNGMVGRDFIKAFNDNFTIADHTFLEILASLIYKVKSTDIKEFRVIDDVVSYTLEEPPEEGEEDTRTWTPVDITAWGNITGDITEQTDLYNILQDKAAVETVATISNLVSTIDSDLSALISRVADDENTINSHTNSISTLLSDIATKVSSSNIQEIRVNNSVFQWKVGNTWDSQPIVTSIAWGHLTGDITTQQDLMYYFNNINTSITNINTSLNTLSGSVSTLNQSVTSLDTSLGNQISEFNSYKNTTNGRLNTIESNLTSATSDLASLNTSVSNHLIDYNNPHHVTKATLGLEYVDNTADLDKPISNPQKTYVDNKVQAIIEQGLDGASIISASGYIHSIFVGDSTLYNNLSSKDGLLAFVIDSSNFIINLMLYTVNYTLSDFSLMMDGSLLQPTSTSGTDTAIYENIAINHTYIVELTLSGETYQAELELDFSGNNTINIDDLFEDINEGGNE